MNKSLDRAVFIATLSITCITLFPQSAGAVPPPDFLFNVGAQVIQVFSLAALFLSAFVAIAYRYIKTKLTLLKPIRKKILVGSLAGIIIVSIGSAFIYGEYKQNTEYNKWLAESEMYNKLQEEQNEFLKNKYPNFNPYEEEKNEEKLRLDKLNIGENGLSAITAHASEEKFISYLDENGKSQNTQFIEEYYGAIANGDLDKAYDLSKQNVDLETFKSWYTSTTKITLDKLVRIDNEKSSLELTLFEGSNYIKYGVLITLKFENENPVQIADSKVTVLKEGVLKEEVEETAAMDEYYEEPVFKREEEKQKSYDRKFDSELSITNEELNDIFKSGSDDYIVLDTRENVEYDYGHFPGSIHIRFADLKAGRWIELPQDKTVYAMCYAGIRGKEITEFLRSKGINAYYPQNGARGWVDWGGKWEGSIGFSKVYTDKKYKLLFTTEEVKKHVAEGVVLVDTREPWKFKSRHIEGSLNIPTMYTPTIAFEDAYNQVPPNSTVITVCDDYVNCFDAKVTAVELLERGHTFLGRYNKPWEYE